MRSGKAPTGADGLLQRGYTEVMALAGQLREKMTPGRGVLMIPGVGQEARM